MVKNTFKHRIAFAVWLNDFRSVPIVNEAWPSIRLDKQIVKDYRAVIMYLKNAGYTALDIFGLITNSNWPVAINEALSEERKAAVKGLIDFAHETGLKVIYGLGVYSWGFNTIIESDTKVKGTNPYAMCGSKEESRAWMRKVIDFVEENLNIDGYHLEAADQGRCECELCGRESNIEYFSRINMETADYIRSNWPERTILVNTSGYLPWGEYVRPFEFKYIYELSNSIDIFIDGGNHGLYIQESDRKVFIDNLQCDYGTSGGFWIYPPQHWDRHRWFLPSIRLNAGHLKQLFEDGGRSCELYIGPLANPSTEMVVLCSGLLLNDIDRSTDSLLEEGVERLYRPKNLEARKVLIQIFAAAEDAFFNSWTKHRIGDTPEQLSDGIDSLFKWSARHLERAIPGELFLEPLLTPSPGPPVYLAVHMDSQGRRRYKKELERIQGIAYKHVEDFQEQERFGRILRCISNVILDIDSVQKEVERFTRE